MKKLETLLIMVGIILGFLTLWQTCSLSTPLPRYEEEIEEIYSETVLAKKNVTVTFYNPTKKQCGNTPLITADGSRIDLDKLRQGKLRWCAVSRDLLQVYTYGDEIWIESENPKIRGYWVVRDTMASWKKNSVDLLLPVEHKTGFGKEHTFIKNQLPRYLMIELGWEEWVENDPHFIENTLSQEDGATEGMIKKNGN